MTKTIVMIHGMWGSGAMWSNYHPFFEAHGYRVIVPTLRYHEPEYRITPPEALGTLSLLDYAADLEALIRGLDEKPIIMGHSMGGLLAQILASRGLAEQLVLLTPAPSAGINALRPSSTRTFLSVLTQWGFWKKPMRVTFEEAKFGILNELSPDEQVAAYQDYSYESGQAAYEIAFWIADRRHAARVDATKVTCPVLTIAGGKDRIVPESVVRQTAKKFKSTYKVYKKHGHSVLNERGWEEIAGYVADWLKVSSLKQD